MKTSNYNIFFPFEEKIVAYNSLTDSYMIIEQALKELLETSIEENCIEKLENIHPEFYNTLCQKGFVINDKINELEEIKKISYKTDFDSKTYLLTINSTMNCNFKCWYCYESHIKNSKVSDDTLKKMIAFIDNILIEKGDELENFQLSWFGGEPLLYYKKTILPLLKNIYPKMQKNGTNFLSSFTSNGYLINEERVQDFKKYGVKHLQITLDGNKAQHNTVRYVSNTKGSYDKIIENIILCLSNQLTITVRINVSPKTLDGIEDIINDFIDLSDEQKKYLTFSFHKVWQESNEIQKDISKVVALFRDHKFKVAYIGDNISSIWNSCYADKLNSATINYNGDVFKCTARDFKKENREGVLKDKGEIDWDNNKLHKRLKKSRFSNKPCLECKILPICNGGCSQLRIENEGKDYCVHGFDNKRKLNVVKERFYSVLHNS